MPAKPVAPRVRTRPAATKAEPAATPAKGHNKVPTQEMITAAATYYGENKLANSARGKADKARKTLLGAMKDGDIDSFPLTVQTPAGPVNLVATVDTPDQEFMDPRKLWIVMECDRKPANRDKYFGIISATKTAVVAALGTDVAAQIEGTRPGTTNANVREPK